MHFYHNINLNKVYISDNTNEVDHPPDSTLLGLRIKSYFFTPFNSKLNIFMYFLTVSIHKLVQELIDNRQTRREQKHQQGKINFDKHILTHWFPNWLLVEPKLYGSRLQPFVVSTKHERDYTLLTSRAYRSSQSVNF